MADYDFERDMTPEQVALAREAGAYARDRAKGAHLYQDLKLGEMLIVGRKVAMELAGGALNKADGRRYADQFFAWKTRFGFPTTKDYTPLYDAAIVCAEHRQDADDIIGSLSVKERIKLGIHGLAKRVRERIREREGGLRKPHAAAVKRLTPLAAMKAGAEAAEGELADAKERLAAEVDGDAFDFRRHKRKPEYIAKQIFEGCVAVGSEGLGLAKRVYAELGQIIGERTEVAKVAQKERAVANLQKDKTGKAKPAHER
jgi:hypothetical protein